MESRRDHIQEQQNQLMTEKHWIPWNRSWYQVKGDHKRLRRLKRHGVSGETLAAAGSSNGVGVGPGGATVSARDIDRIAYLPAAAAEHPPSARLSARRRLQPGKFSPLHGYRLARRLRPRGRKLAHRVAGETRPESASLPREVPAGCPRLRPTIRRHPRPLTPRD